MPSPDSIKLLLVDDAESNLLALDALLRRDDIELFKVRSGPEALELLLVHEFALALLDVHMPDMDGFELAELMRGTDRTRSIPIIFITAVATDERRRFRGYEAGAVDYLLKPFDPQTLKNKVAIFVELDRQRRDLARQRDELRATADQLSAALSRIQAHGDNSPLAIAEFDPSLRIIAWSKGAERMFGWSSEEIAGRKVADVRWLHENDMRAFLDASSEMLAGARPRTVHVARTYHKGGSIIECEWYHSVLLDNLGRPVSINSQILDITERKRAEQTQQLLIGELNHRVKNTLATVHAIATQTLRHSRTPAAFAADFAGRIQSLARAHSLLSDTTWKGTSLITLIEDQLRVGAVDESRLGVSGRDVFLPPQTSLHLALILHELITNANKYGALSTSRGRVDLSWEIAHGRLTLRWIESGHSGVKAPSRRGFGSTLIERSVKAEGGGAHAIYRADGVTWEMTLAVPRMSGPRWHQPRPAPVTKSGNLPARREVSSAAMDLTGRRFLVVEDEPLIALEIMNILEDRGAEIAGPAATTDQALQIIETTALDGAFLDANLHGHSVDGLALALTRRHVPFAFVSGYGKEALPDSFANAAVVNKPFSADELIEMAKKLAPGGQLLALQQ